MADVTFFFPNVCHVCKKWDEKLISCAKCQMISYCNEEHQEEHLPQHQEICAVIKHVLGDKEYMNTEEISAEEWFYIRQEYANKVADILQRNLKNEESQMFIFPKACVVCHRQDTVIRCNDCPSSAFCDKHRDESEHRENCIALRDCFEIDKVAALTEKIDISYIDRVSNNIRDFNNMSSFLDTYVPLDKNDLYIRMFHSDQVSMPLTVYFCIQNLDYLFCKTLDIHVIRRPLNLCIREELHLWKMLPLLISTLTTLTITFIQAENVSSKCDISEEVLEVSETQQLVVNVCCMPYEVYMGTADFQKPNFIVGFQSYVFDGNYERDIHVDISEKSGKALAENACPCILIFEHIPPIHEEIIKETKEYYFFGANPFTTLMMYRHVLTGSIFYPDNYLIIFTNLDSSSVFIDKRNQCVLFTNRTRE